MRIAELQDRGKLLRWYHARKRDMPWRRTSDPYAVWISEIMLQQTQVVTATPYYERWMDAFPTAESLAQADEQSALALWQGLGYYRRCRNLLAGAQIMGRDGIPKTAAEWLKIPGVGRYTSAAIASICFKEPVPLVDGNVERVFARLTACRASDAELHKLAWKWAEKNVHPHEPGDWNQALMELGATVCTPTAPLCNECPMSGECLAHRYELTGAIPKPKSKPQTLSLTHYVRVPYWNGKFGLRQIPKGEWWHGMWEFPRNIEPFKESWDGSEESLGTIKHTVTRHKIEIVATLVKLHKPIEGVEWYEESELDALPIPAPQRKILKQALESCLQKSLL